MYAFETDPEYIRITQILERNYLEWRVTIYPYVSDDRNSCGYIRVGYINKRGHHKSSELCMHHDLLERDGLGYLLPTLSEFVFSQISEGII